MHNGIICLLSHLQEILKFLVKYSVTMVLCLLMFFSCHLRLAVLFQLDADTFEGCTLLRAERTGCGNISDDSSAI